MIFLQGAIKVYRDFYKSLCMEVCSAKLCEGKIKFIAHRKGVQCERCVKLRKCGSVTVFMLIGIESSVKYSVESDWCQVGGENYFVWLRKFASSEQIERKVCVMRYFSGSGLSSSWRQGRAALRSFWQNWRDLISFPFCDEFAALVLQQPSTEKFISLRLKLKPFLWQSQTLLTL